MSASSVYEHWASRRSKTQGIIRFGAQHPTHPWWTIADIVCEALVGYHRALLPEVRVGVFTSTDLQGALWNPVDVGTGDLTLAITTPSAAARMAAEGTGPYRTPSPGLRAIAAYPHLDFVVFMVSARTGITSLRDLVKKRYPLRLVTGRKNRGHADILTFTVEEVLRQYGASYDAIEHWGGRVWFGGPTHIGGSLVLEGQADAMFQEHRHAKIWRQIADVRPMHCLAVDEPVLQHIRRTYGFAAAEIPAGAYRGVERPVRTVDFSGWLVFCREDMPEEWAYAVAQACDVTREQVTQALRDPELLTWNPASWANPSGYMFTHTSIPLHPGAEAYARERGYVGRSDGDDGNSVRPPAQ
jgi:uncharacterized protein